MPYENIYIQKVAAHPHIYSDEELMRKKRGTWKEYFQKERLMLEIGTGMGNFFSNYAGNHPEVACV
jgi:tRNA G46 methylase TrmB